MKQFYTFICFLSLLVTTAQERSTDFKLADKKFTKYGVTNTGGFYMVEPGLDEFKSRVTLLDEDWNKVYTFHGEQKIAGYELKAISPSGRYMLYHKNKSYYLIDNGKSTLFSKA